ncbi:hypothetical protein [Streptomyces sp. MMS24-I29]|uniref:hypothetical protein n=1 Tax=Streptomyces sp. MMS24-I29 TaxID=3351480 RepID=UPI003C7D5C06
MRGSRCAGSSGASGHRSAACCSPCCARAAHDAATGTYGWPAPGQYGQYGLVSLDDGRFYVARNGTVQEGGVTKQTARAELHTWTGRLPSPFSPAGPAA